MRKVTLLAILLVSIFTSAQESRLTIFSENGDAFYVILNGIRQNEEPAVNLAVDYLINDYYDTKIIFADESIPQIEKRSLMVVDVDGRRGEFTYKIKETRRGKKLRFFSFTPFQAILPPPSNVTLIHYNPNPLGPIQTVTQTTTTTTTTGPGENINVDIGINSGGTNVGVGINVNTGNTTTTTTTTTQTVSGAIVEPVILEDTGECFVMSDADFNQAMVTINNKSFEDSKLAIAKQVIKGNCVTAAQIAIIASNFTFEETKLEFAKYAYTLCFNPENYWKVNNVFEFESSIDELNEYIESFGH
ncbi:DUF4476 domain-containing protein [uncultured Winogradskyella sp.]|uniref:DUF4476 domain-containing protein n=1 Tax=uncultured Winogradskyella sp. TaxID=395353 RepID=UPI003513487A